MAGYTVKYPENRFYLEVMNGEYGIFERNPNAEEIFDTLWLTVSSEDTDERGSLPERATAILNALNAYNEIGLMP